MSPPLTEVINQTLLISLIDSLNYFIPSEEREFKLQQNNLEQFGF